MSGWLSVALVLAMATAAGSAGANGRFPLAGQLVVDRDDPRIMVARTTYGLARTIDGGASWRWTCEKAIGYDGVFDPPLVLAAPGPSQQGAIVAGLTYAVARSVDGACTFARSSEPPLGAQWAIDLALDPSDARHVVAITAPLDDAPEFRATLAHSHDGGGTFTAAASLLPEDVAPTTLDVAPSNPARVWIAGNAAFVRFGALLHTDDGVTFRSSIFDLRGGRAPYIGAVDPKDQDRLWLRIDGDVRDRVVLVSGAGTRLADVFEGEELLGLAVSPDGARIAVGGPKDGLWIASTLPPPAGHAFTQVSALHVRCLTWTSAGLYACADDLVDGFSVGLSTDEGRTFAPVFRRSTLRPLPCALDTCAGAWRDVALAIGADPRLVLPDAGPDAGPDGDAARDAAPDASTRDDVSAADASSAGAASASGYGCTTRARPTSRSADERAWSAAGWLALFYVTSRWRGSRARP